MRPNMTYCMFENTALAMRQILTELQDDGDSLIDNMSEFESRGYSDLKKLCREFLELVEYIDEE